MTLHTNEETSHFLWKVAISVPYLQERVASPFLKEHEYITPHTVSFLSYILILSSLLRLGLKIFSFLCLLDRASS